MVKIKMQNKHIRKKRKMSFEFIIKTLRAGLKTTYQKS
ncbi:hypothetical protein LEP1GSC056_2143 [Leptospira borgpetersenii str. Brem 328]|uniref:Uncharacterized protein n=1 Tax=Leptospira borgpetersenii str. Brem 328 TaxID=1049780 RepID=A0ABC9SN66_LEPBO|nr:hypothetical protein LEP1GSC056_2143 [Leptospira borgpetersenii str. Brem 328]